MDNCLFCYKPVKRGNYHPACSVRFFGSRELPLLDLDQEKLEYLALHTVQKRIAVAGVQPKLSLNLKREDGKKRLTIVELGGQYILKPQSEDYLFMPETEDLTMHLAGVFEIETAEHSLVPVSSGELVYITKRFDRRNGHKIHVEDLCQLSNLLTEQKYKSSYERAGKILRKYATNRGFDAIRYFRVILFSFLTGNNDMHLKNFSLIHSDRGVLFAPAYDLLNVNLIYPEDKEETALTLNGEKSKIKRKDFDALAASLEIPEKVRNNIYGLFASRNREVETLVSSCFLPSRYQVEYLLHF